MKVKFILLIFVFCIAVFGNTLNAQNVVSVIPYELMSKKMIVKLQVNGKMERFILDTGAELSMFTESFFNANNFQITDSISVSDANNRTFYQKLTVAKEIITPDKKVSFENVRMSLFKGRMLECFDVAGIIGSDLLSKYICIFDSKKQTLTLTSTEKRSPESLRYSHRFVDKGVLPKISLMIAGSPVSVLFDTGAPSFIMLNRDVFNHLDSIHALQVIDKGSGATNTGFGGTQLNDDASKIKIDDLRIGLAKFSNLVETAHFVRTSLLGIDVLDYGKVVIDYSRELFYYIPFTNNVVELPYTPRMFEVELNYDGLLSVSVVWSKMEGLLSKGDLITHINGKPTKKYEICDGIKKGINTLIGKNPKVMTIKTKEGKVLEVAY